MKKQNAMKKVNKKIMCEGYKNKFMKAPNILRIF